MEMTVILEPLENKAERDTRECQDRQENKEILVSEECLDFGGLLDVRENLGYQDNKGLEALKGNSDQWEKLGNRDHEVLPLYEHRQSSVIGLTFIANLIIYIFHY